MIHGEGGRRCRAIRTPEVAPGRRGPTSPGEACLANDRALAALGQPPTRPRRTRRPGRRRGVAGSLRRIGWAKTSRVALDRTGTISRSPPTRLPMRTLRLIAAGCVSWLAAGLARGDGPPPRVVVAWAAGPMEARVAFDRAVDPAVARLA